MENHFPGVTKMVGMLLERGITPENLPPGEDLKKIQRKFDGDDKNVLKNVKTKGRKKA
jgi:DNA-damage-inducible protein D